MPKAGGDASSLSHKIASDTQAIVHRMAPVVTADPVLGAAMVGTAVAGDVAYRTGEVAYELSSEKGGDEFYKRHSQLGRWDKATEDYRKKDEFKKDHDNKHWYMPNRVSEALDQVDRGVTNLAYGSGQAHIKVAKTIGIDDSAWVGPASEFFYLVGKSLTAVSSICTFSAALAEAFAFVTELASVGFLTPVAAVVAAGGAEAGVAAVGFSAGAVIAYEVAGLLKAGQVAAGGGSMEELLDINMALADTLPAVIKGVFTIRSSISKIGTELQEIEETLTKTPWWMQQMFRAMKIGSRAWASKIPRLMLLIRKAVMLINKLKEVWKSAKETVERIGKFIGSLFKDTIESVKFLLPKIIDLARKGGNIAVDFAIGLFRKVVHFTAKLMKSGIDHFHKIRERFLQAAKHRREAVTKMVHAVIGLIHTGFSTVKSLVRGGLISAIRHAPGAIHRFAGDLKKAFLLAESLGEGVVDDYLEAFKFGFDETRDFHTELMEALGAPFGPAAGLIKSAFKQGAELAKQVGGKALKAAESGWEFLINAGGSIVSLAKDVISGGLDAVLNFVQRLLGTVLGFGSHLGEIIMGKIGSITSLVEHGIDFGLDLVFKGVHWVEDKFAQLMRGHHHKKPTHHGGHTHKEPKPGGKHPARHEPKHHHESGHHEPKHHQDHHKPKHGHGHLEPKHEHHRGKRRHKDGTFHHDPVGQMGVVHPHIGPLKGHYKDGDLTGPFFYEGYEGTEFASAEGALNGGATVYVNGIRTSLDEHLAAAQALAKKIKKVVVGVYNASDGALGDGLQYLLTDKLEVFDPRSNKATATMIRLIEGHKNLNVYAHSQGTLITANAIRAAQEDAQKKGLNKTAYTKGMDVTFMGTAATSQVGGVKNFHSYMYDSDLVSSTMGPNTSWGRLASMYYRMTGHLGQNNAKSSVLHSSKDMINPHDVTGYIDNLDKFKKSEKQTGSLGPSSFGESLLASGLAIGRGVGNKVVSGVSSTYDSIAKKISSLPITNPLVRSAGMGADTLMRGLGKGIETAGTGLMSLWDRFATGSVQQEYPVQKSPVQGGDASDQFVANLRTKSKGFRPSEGELQGLNPQLTAAGRGTVFHADAEAANAARDLRANAFAVGNEVYFGEGKYNPTSTKGKGLMAHELTHVVQQASGVMRNSPEGMGGHEREAQQAQHETEQQHMTLTNMSYPKGIGQAAALDVVHLESQYEAVGEIQVDDQLRARLDGLASQAVEQASALLRHVPGMGGVKVSEMQVFLDFDMDRLTDDEVVQKWAQAIADGAKLHAHQNGSNANRHSLASPNFEEIQLDASGEAVKEPGFWEGLIPIWGSGKQAVHDYETGHWAWGTINAALALSDLIGAGIIVKAGYKALSRVAVHEAEYYLEKQVERKAESEAELAAEKEAEEIRRAGRKGGKPGHLVKQAEKDLAKSQDRVRHAFRQVKRAKKARARKITRFVQKDVEEKLKEKLKEVVSPKARLKDFAKEKAEEYSKKLSPTDYDKAHPEKENDTHREILKSAIQLDGATQDAPPQPTPAPAAVDPAVVIKAWLNKHQFAPPAAQPLSGDKHVLLNGQDMSINDAVSAAHNDPDLKQPDDKVKDVINRLLNPASPMPVPGLPFIGPGNQVPGVPLMDNRAVMRMVELEDLDKWLDDGTFMKPNKSDDTGAAAEFEGKKTTVDEIAAKFKAMGRAPYLTDDEVLYRVRQRYVVAKAAPATQVVLGYTFIPSKQPTTGDPITNQHQISFTITRAYHADNQAGPEISAQGAFTYDSDKKAITNFQGGLQGAYAIPLLGQWVQASGLVQLMGVGNFDPVKGTLASGAVQLGAGAQVLITPNFEDDSKWKFLNRLQLGLQAVGSGQIDSQGGPSAAAQAGFVLNIITWQ